MTNAGRRRKVVGSNPTRRVAGVVASEGHEALWYAGRSCGAINPKWDAVMNQSLVAALREGEMASGPTLTRTRGGSVVGDARQPTPGYRTWEQMVTDVIEEAAGNSFLDPDQERDIRAIVRETLEGYGLDKEQVSP